MLLQVPWRLLALAAASLLWAHQAQADDANEPPPTVPTSANEALGFFQGSRVYLDDDILVAIQRQLAGDPRVETFLIHVDVHDAQVVLTGTARSLAVHDAALETARGVRGVRSVEDLVQVAPRVVAPDLLSRRVAHRLAHHPVAQALGIEARVVGSVVTLRGTAPSWSQRHAVEEAIKAVDGLSRVDNRITLVKGHTRTDENILTDVRWRLDHDGWINSKLVRVRVGQGAVALRGSVESAIERARAVHLAWVDSVVAVDDRALEVDFSWNAAWARRGAVPRTSDADLERSLRQALRDDPCVAYSGAVRVDADRGRVVLTGTVNALEASYQAADVAASIPGVWMVDNAIRVQPGRRVDDIKVSTLVKEALATDPYVHARDIQPATLHGRVQLNGMVDNQFQRRWAERVVAAVEGVVEIDNQIGISEAWSNDTDRRIASNMQSALDWSPYWTGTQVTVNVMYGTVTLGGQVAGWREWRYALSQAERSGAKRIVDQITAPSRPVVNVATQGQ